MASVDMLLEGAPPPTDGSRQDPRILIVEDEADLAATCARFFRQLGYRAEIARSALEALAQTETATPDAVLVAVRPGRLDGLEIMRRLRERAPRLPVVVCTANAPNRARQAALAAGATAVLNQPFSLAELRAVVERALGAVRPDGFQPDV